ncbi:FapA family protein [Halanaerobium sp. Z-7514]|uniref:FapA family protein n=1 Tax=Halanaerobium polyolivorans TaxID=2886943 RepID=A0AAW4WVP7_9FIRM|nr:FapA family protein [Halanaerobium polyolivorans]MCC3145183.1 FapA family protein [Halanaerobium polyolivorans]
MEDNKAKNNEDKLEIEVDDEIELKLSQDKMQLKIDFSPGQNGEKISLESIQELLAEKGIKYGIKEETIKEIVKRRDPVLDKLIAEGKKPIKGEDGKLIYHFQEKEKKAGIKREDGSINYFSRDLINNVRVGEKIITKIDPVPGEKGINIFAEEVDPPPLKEAKLPKIKNTVKKEQSIYAAKDGQVVVNKQKVKLRPIFQVNGDLDLETGNIDFVGSVKINGNVKAGFVIKADGDVEIAGNVGASNIEAGANVLIKKGFIGRNKGKIKAEGDLKAGFIENAEVKANNVTVYKSIMHSQVRAKDSVEVTAGKGVIVGGKVTARNKIEANIIGSNLATKTKIVIGLGSEMKNTLSENEKELAKLSENLEKIAKSLNILKEAVEKGVELSPQKIELFKKLNKTKLEMEKRKNELQKENKELKAELKSSQKSIIKVNQIIYPGVQLLSKRDKMIISNKTSSSVFSEVNKELRQIVE